MRRIPTYFTSLALLGILFFCRMVEAQTTSVPSRDTGIFLADPTVFFEDGVFYLYGTSGENPDLGFQVYVSKDLNSWRLSGVNSGFALRKEDVFGDKGFWAPQVFKRKGTYYMAYTANEEIAIAQATSPLGPFTQTTQRSLPADVKQIDPFVFFDGDKAYLYHVRLKKGNRLYVGELDRDLANIIDGTLHECITAEDKWENTQHVPWPVAEGPRVMQVGDEYVFIYSANDFRNPDYAVGYASAPSPVGPWTKSEANPVLSTSLVGMPGTGHGDVFQDGDNLYWYVFHTHFSDNEVAPRRTALMRLEFEIDKFTKTISIRFLRETLRFPSLGN